MEYTVQELANLAGVTSRTIRYYDEIDLLNPDKYNSSGYRIYSKNEVDILQQILFYKELGIDLSTIKEIIKKPDFDEIKALNDHRKKLVDKKERLELLISNVNKTLKSKERKIKMSDKDKFEGFKKKLIKENEEKYGDEIRKKYGEESVIKSNDKIKKMSKKDYEKVNQLEEELLNILKSAIKTGEPAGKLGQKAAKLHKQWVSFYWDSYSKEAHAGLAQMYVSDERFKSYYDEKQPGAAEFLKDAILIYTGINE